MLVCCLTETAALLCNLSGMTRPLRIAVLMAFTLTLLLALLAALIASFDWNRAKPWINSKLTDATGRTFMIDGDLRVSWQLGAQAAGWRHFLPWLQVRATDVRLANPDWAASGALMAQLPALDFTLNPWPLLVRDIRVAQLHLSAPVLVFEKQGERRRNWDFALPASGQRSQWRLVLERLAVSDGQLRYVEPDKRTDLQLALSTAHDGCARWQARGRYHGEPLAGSGSAGSLLALRARGVRYPVDAQLRIGATQLRAQGTVTDPADPSALDIQLRLSGKSMADLFPISGLLLPDTPAYATHGRVLGRLTPGRLALRYEHFSGRVGQSDIAGTLHYRQQAPRPTLQGEVTSQQLRLIDLGRLIGSGERPRAGASGDAPGESRQPRGRVLPVARFKTERWDSMDVDVRFSGRHIVRKQALPIERLETRIRMQDGHLSLDPLAFGVAGGELTGSVQIDGQSEPARGKLALHARRLALAQLFPKIGSAPASIGRLNGQLQLAARGNSVAALLGTASGELRAVVGRGTVSKFVLEAAGLNIANAVFVRLFGDQQVALNCLVADLQFNDGIALTRVFVLDTAETTVKVSGAINLQGERYDLTLLPQSKGLRVLSLRSPLYVQGSFADPDIGVDKRSVALKAGAALVLGTAAAPVAGLLALINPGDPGQSPCARLLQRAGARDVREDGREDGRGDGRNAAPARP